MLFDSLKAERLYRAYCNSSPKNSLVTEIHELTADLIKVIAGSLDRSDYFDDLVQEGHLKLQLILVNHKYKPGTRCSMYTFLCFCLKNAMIDYLRKLKRYQVLDSDSDLHKLLELQPGLDTAAFKHYYQYRFPSLADGFSLASYVEDTVIERALRRKVINTLINVYDLSRNQANLLYNSVAIFLRCSVVKHLDELILSDSLQYAHNGSEFTLKPECVLLGLETTVRYKDIIKTVHTLVDHNGSTKICNI